MRGVYVIGSQLKSTKLPELYRIVPAELAHCQDLVLLLCELLSSLSQRPSCDSAHGDGSSGRATSTCEGVSIRMLSTPFSLFSQFATPQK